MLKKKREERKKDTNPNPKANSKSVIWEFNERVKSLLGLEMRLQARRLGASFSTLKMPRGQVLWERGVGSLGPVTRGPLSFPAQPALPPELLAGAGSEELASLEML